MTEDPKKPQLLDIRPAIEAARRAAEQSAPTPEQLMRQCEQDARMARSRALEAAEPSLTDEDLRLLISDTADLTAPLRAVHGFMSSPAPLLVLHGGIGTGKTLAACKAIAMRGGHFVSAMDLAGIFTSYQRIGRKEELLQARVLVVDDIGQELDASRLTPILTELINRRRSHGRRTIWTSNLSPDDIRLRYADDRLWSRVSQCVQDEGFAGSDLRRGKR